MKRKADLSLNIIIITIILLVVLVVVLLIFTGKIKLFDIYDPATDKCILEVDDCDNSMYTICGTNSYGLYSCYCDKTKCVSWKDKTKCELNPEAKGCVCDEYTRGDCDKYLNHLSDLCKINIFNCNPTEEFIVDEYRQCQDKQWKCIKSHEANECEKKNSNYVFDLNMPCVCRDQPSTGNRIQVGSNETKLCNKIDCSMNCRKKTIEDFNCAQLKKAIHTQQYVIINDINNEYSIRLGHRQLLESVTHILYSEEIYDVAIKKGCDI